VQINDCVILWAASSQVVLTVQQRTGTQKVMGSPSVHNRPLTTPSRITGPQPVDVSAPSLESNFFLMEIFF
jgi:hypothetical protein